MSQVIRVQFENCARGPKKCESRQYAIAIVDDDAGVRGSLKWLVEAEDYSAATYDSARKFLGVGSTNPPDCLIADINMPEMSGVELAMAIRPHAGGIPIIFITSSPDTPLARRASLLQPAGIFTKPIDTQALLDLLDRLRAGTADRPKEGGSCRK